MTTENISQPDRKALADEASKRCVGCDIPNGCPEYCRCDALTDDEIFSIFESVEKVGMGSYILGVARAIEAEVSRRLAAHPVQEPAGDAWTITSPNGRTWTGDSPVKAAGAAQRDTVDPVLAMERINAMVGEENAIRDAELAEAFERGKVELTGLLADVLRGALRIPTMPFPDPAAHSLDAYARAVHAAYCAIRFKVMDALAALSASPAAPVEQPAQAVPSWWQPIETAPKDGTKILVHCPRLGVCGPAKWDDNRFNKNPRPFWTHWGIEIRGLREVRDDQPTHWMPRPAAPSAQPTSAQAQKESE